MKIRVGVIFGGETVEHEVSVITAVQAMSFIDEDKYDIVPIYITKEKEWYTGNLLKDMYNYRDLDLLKKYAKNVVLYNKKGRFVLQSKKGFKRVIDEIDVALLSVHGSNVEDGTLQGYLELIGVPYIGGNLYSGVVGQDKVFMKQIFEVEKLPITKYVWFFDSEYKDDSDKIIDKIKELKFPVIIKPAKLGSSIGINIVSKVEDLKASIEEAIQYDTKIVVEEVIKDLREFNCSVLGDYEYQETSEIEEVFSSSKLLTFNDKYIGNGKGCKTKGSKGMASADRIIPAPIDEKLKQEIRNISISAFKVLNGSGVCRMDFLYDNETNKVYISEINTIPGCLSFYLWEPVNKSYKQLLDDLIALAIKGYKKRNKLIYSFDTNILKDFNKLKGNKGKLKS